MQNSRFRNAKAQLSLFNRIIFTKQGLFLALPLRKKGKPMRSKFLSEHGVERAKFRGVQIVDRQ